MCTDWNIDSSFYEDNIVYNSPLLMSDMNKLENIVSDSENSFLAEEVDKNPNDVLKSPFINNRCWKHSWDPIKSSTCAACLLIKMGGKK